MADKKTAEIKLNLLEPRATEKTYREQAKRTYVFPMELGASKQEIAMRVEKEFNVTVTDVRTLVRNGKKTKFSKGKHAYPGITHRKDKKFAYVTLKDGDSIRVFDEPEAKDEKKADKASVKKEDKASAKDAKAEKAKADKKAGKENK